MLAAALFYGRNVKKGAITPALSTWIIFLLGTGLSLTTYVIASDGDVRTGILNTADTASVAITLASVFIWGNRRVYFKSYEKWYLVGLAVIVAYGVVTGDAWRSNLFTQVVIGFGYLPTYHKLIKEKKNTEPFSAWICDLVASLISLQPVLASHNSLAIVYSLRSAVMLSCILGVMLYYERRSKRA